MIWICGIASSAFPGDFRSPLHQGSQAYAAIPEGVAYASRGKDAVLSLRDNTSNTHSEEHVLVLEMADENCRKHPMKPEK